MDHLLPFEADRLPQRKTSRDTGPTCYTTLANGAPWVVLACVRIHMILHSGKADMLTATIANSRHNVLVPPLLTGAGRGGLPVPTTQG